jgi:HK97 family phage major capsid protein
MRSNSRSDEEFHQKLRDNAMRVVEKATIPHPQADQDGARSQLMGLLDYGDSANKELATRLLYTGSPVYRRIFNKYLSSQPLTNDEQRYAAVTTGGTTTGGYATPWVLDPTIIGIGAHTSTNPFRAACRVVNLVGSNKWEALTATEVLSAYAGEAIAPAEGGPTFGQPTYNCLKASSFVTLSFEIIEDRPDIMSEVATLIQESKDTLEEASFSAGAGTTVPWGVSLLAEYTTLKTVGAAAIILADILALEAALPIRHRANAAFFMSRQGIRHVQSLETVAGVLFGQPFATVGTPQRNATGNTGLQLLGYPVWEAPTIPGTVTTPDTNPIVFCDPKSYIIVDRVGLNMEVVQNVTEHAAGSRPMLQRGLLAHWRNTARRVNVDAGRTMVVE